MKSTPLKLLKETQAVDSKFGIMIYTDPEKVQEIRELPDGTRNEAVFLTKI